MVKWKTLLICWDRYTKEVHFSLIVYYTFAICVYNKRRLSVSKSPRNSQLSTIYLPSRQNGEGISLMTLGGGGKGSKQLWAECLECWEKLSPELASSSSTIITRRGTRWYPAGFPWREGNVVPGLVSTSRATCQVFLDKSGEMISGQAHHDTRNCRDGRWDQPSGLQHGVATSWVEAIYRDAHFVPPVDIHELQGKQWTCGAHQGTKVNSPLLFSP